MVLAQAPISMSVVSWLAWRFAWLVLRAERPDPNRAYADAPANARNVLVMAAALYLALALILRRSRLSVDPRAGIIRIELEK